MTVVAGVLLVLYPLIDVVATLIDARSQHGFARQWLLINAGTSILAAVAATRHAVALSLLTPTEAGAIWDEVASRHPEARWCSKGPELASSVAA